MRYALLADLHGASKALRRILAAAAEAGVDEVVCLGDYLEAKVPRRLHDPSRHWPLPAVVDPDPPLWSSLATLRLVEGNQEQRVRELLRPGQVPGELAAILDRPERAQLHGVLGMHGHQIRWTLVGDDEMFLPSAADVPRVPVVVVGHTHQVAAFEITWAGPSVRPLACEPGVPLRLGESEPGGGPPSRTLLINTGLARRRPHHWLLYDTERGEITFRVIARPPA